MPSAAAAQAPRRVLFLAYPRVVPLDLIGPWEVFQAANYACAGRAVPYELQLRSMTSRREIEAPTGPLFLETGGCRRAGPIDTLVVPATDDVATVARTSMSARGRRTLLSLVNHSRRLVSICGGAFLLAAAGLLDGRRATTHWMLCDRLASEYPDVTVEPDAIYVKDGNIYSSAGMTAGIDLALMLVEEDLGADVALAVARGLVVFVRRPGGQTQFSAALAAQTSSRNGFADLMAWAAANPAADLTVDALANRMNMSVRHFARVFRDTVGQTPAVCIERIRVDAARQRLEHESVPLDAVASACGFGSADSMRRVFLRALKVTPTDYRSRFRRAGVAPEAPVSAGRTRGRAAS
ncbi:MAG: GlxA family transcriptional regulator [Vicinamibacterales bacterium]